jgi:lysophospholipase L1-like esterase
MIKKLIILVFVALVLNACSKTTVTETPNNNNPSDTAINKKFRYLALGDSYTIGHSVNAEERFPEQLVGLLKSAGYNSVQLEIIAKTGWTTGELLSAIDTENPADNYNLVTLLIGVNNQYRGLDTNEYRKELKVLLNRAISFAAGSAERVIIVSIPDYGVTPFAQSMDTAKIAREIDAYNAIKYNEASNYSVKFINITSISRKAKTVTDLIATDGLHPSGKMYAEWVEKIYPYALQILQSQ